METKSGGMVDTGTVTDSGGIADTGVTRAIAAMAGDIIAGRGLSSATAIPMIMDTAARTMVIARRTMVMARTIHQSPMLHPAIGVRPAVHLTADHAGHTALERAAGPIAVHASTDRSIGGRVNILPIQAGIAPAGSLADNLTGV